jgi:hypothetical protein
VQLPHFGTELLLDQILGRIGPNRVRILPGGDMHYNRNRSPTFKGFRPRALISLSDSAGVEVF